MSTFDRLIEGPLAFSVSSSMAIVGAAGDCLARFAICLVSTGEGQSKIGKFLIFSLTRGGRYLKNKNTSERTEVPIQEAKAMRMMGVRDG